MSDVRPVAATRHRIVFTPSGLDGAVDHGTSVLDAARHLGVDLDSVCGGRGICGRCQVVAGVGSFAKWAITARPDALDDLGPSERDYRGARPLADGHRLGCAAHVIGDVVIDVPASSQVHRQVVRKDLDLPPIVVDPGFALYYVEVAPARLGDATTAAGSLCDALVEQHGVARPAVASNVLTSVHRALAADGGAATVAVRHADARPGSPSDGQPGTVVAAWPGFVGSAYGIAVDVGSTTVAGHLCDVTTGEVLASAGVMNPQIRFGEDLMSRVSYVMMNAGGDRELTNAIRRALDGLVGDLLTRAGVRRDRVLEIVLVGNPVMHHIVLGIDPTPLGSAPFVLATDEPVSGRAGDLGLDLTNASYYVGPCIAGHVGADTAAAILAEGPHRGSTMQLLVDVGTNAEIVLGDATHQFAASSPTGPAFEGAQISCGQRATAGAIERVRIDRDTLEPRVRVIGCDRWSDDPAFADGVAATGVTGLCGSGIIEVVAEMFLAGVIDADGVVRGELAARSTRIVADARTFAYVVHDGPGGRLTITQNDVRAIQLAKAALRAGIDLLIEHAGSPAVDDIRLAGAFGAHIDPVHAMVLGLVPDCPVAGVRSVGNAAGVGAVEALLSRSLRAEMEAAARAVVKIETATEPRFQELFVAAMAFPHATAASPHLASIVELPERANTGGGRVGRRRARRPSPAPGEPTLSATGSGPTSLGGDVTSEPTSAEAQPAEAQPEDLQPEDLQPKDLQPKDPPQGRRGGGRAGRQSMRAAATVARDPFLRRHLAPFEVLSSEGLEIIEHNADTILEQVGVEVRDYPSAIERFRAAGAAVDGTRVRFPRGMCRSIVSATAPATFTQHARNPVNDVQIGGDATVFAPNYGSPFVHDLDAGRRYATLADFQNFVKLAYLHPHLHHSGGTVCEPVDVPVSKRHLDMVYAHLRYSDKAFMGSVTAGERAADSVELARIGFGGDLADRTVLISLINASSPLVWDASMLASAEVYASANQATIITPFILAGAMAPATSAGVAAQTLAEALAGMTFTQLVRPGAPVVFGSFASSMSMQTGAPTFGTPEPALVLYVVAALARRLGVPFRSGGSLTASKLPDAQAAYESAATLVPTVMAGTNFVLHAAGWLEGGLAIGYEKFVLDADQLGMMATFAKGLDMSDNGQALDAICQNPPGQHFLGTAHTLANYETAFHRSEIADNSSYEQWLDDGGLDAAQRANRVWQQRLADYTPPPIDEAIDAELRDYIARRKAELPDTFA